MKHHWRALSWRGWLYFQCENCLEQTPLPSWCKKKCCKEKP